MLKEKLLEDLKISMRDKKEIMKNTIQMVRAAILQIEKDKAIEVDDNQIIEIIAKEVKKRKDAAADFEKSGREDLIKNNNEEIEILSQYLPKQLSKDEISEIVKEVIEITGATSIKDMGAVMKLSKEKMGPSADGKSINEIVKELLG
ncbi:Yqey-like protein [compost metagenome]